ncbi:MAG: cbb3-type cytochrome oxidase assembly protein [Planctomycetes bacterium]|nr:cbb3-type cytochrome oxidase assembly protein [Planctomycetota bacterium]MCB9870091.1 cbb3-type cytochrome oxidase assembly protein [Planctomycetota bacterium]
MSIVPVLVACSLFLALCAVALFAWSVSRGDHEHADRLALLPLEDDLIRAPSSESDSDSIPRQPD